MSDYIIELGYNQRMELLSIFPERGGSFLLRDLVKPLKEQLAVTADELRAADAKELPNGQVGWNAAKEKKMKFALSGELFKIVDDYMNQAERDDKSTDILLEVKKILDAAKPTRSVKE